MPGGLSRRISPAAVPDGTRLYAVGDIHGRADLLDWLSRLIVSDFAARPSAESTTVFLGDYVDRGPASAGVIDRLARGDFPTPTVTLRGNHDMIFEQLMRGEIDVGYYMGLGGAATLASYGIDPVAYAREAPARRIALLRDTIPAAHRAFLAGLRRSFTCGGYFFCHAGVRPGVPLDQQSDEDLMWIRDEFLTSTADFGKVIVHGHTPVRRPLVRDNGIDIDTKAFASGVLTAIVLEGTGHRFLQTG